MSEDHPVDPGRPAPHAEAVHTGTEESGHAPAPKAFGLIDAPMFISLAMIAVLALIIWKRVPGAIGKALDNKIELIRKQLAEAESLRKDAEALKAEYEAKAAAAEGEAAAMIERARQESDAMLVKARENVEALVERRSRMAEEKIAAEERAAVDQLRATAAEAARAAAARLIAERLDDRADERLVNQAIGGLGR